MHLSRWDNLTQIDIDEACGVSTGVITDDRPTFYQYAQMYLDSLHAVNESTRKKYRRILQNIWMPYFAPTPIADITAAMIREAIRGIGKRANRTFNDYLIPLRGTFDLAFIDEVIDDLPTKRIRNKKVQNDEPDPFLPHERKAILDYMSENWKEKKEMWYLYYKWQFWTGCRPSETLALDWIDIDWSKNCFKVSKKLSGGKVENHTKTHFIRNVTLNEMSKEVLLRLKQLTGHQDRVFISLHTNAPWASPDKLSNKLDIVLNALDIRYRVAYNCRHTFATQMLNDTIDMGICSYQLGHDIQTFKTTYAKWLNTEKMFLEMSKLTYD